MKPNVNEQYKMTPLAEAVFIGEIVLQIKIAQQSAIRLFDISNAIDKIDILTNIQAILISTANVSKILWPPPNNKDKEQNMKNRTRGKWLRELLKIDDKNIIHNRKLRNHFEHYDERIGTWYEGDISATYTDFIIESHKPLFEEEIGKHYRCYNHETRTLTFLNDSINLDDVINSLEDIRIKCGQLTLN